jgi:hypothetical protein
MSRIALFSWMTAFLGAFFPAPLNAQLQIWGDTTLTEQAADLITAGGGGFWVLGTKETAPGQATDFSVQRLSAGGQVMQGFTVGTPWFEYASRFFPIPGGFLISGTTAPPGSPVAFGVVIKTDTLGQVLDEWLLGDSIRNYLLRAALPLAGGDVLVIGSVSAENGPGNDPWIARYDSTGNLIWTCSYRDSLSDYAQAAVPLPDGGFAIACDHDTGNGVYNAYVLRLNAGGQVQWAATANSPLNGGSQDLLLLPDGDLLVVGESFPDTASVYFDFYAARVSPGGIWGKSFVTGGPRGDAAFRGLVLPDGRLLLTGYGWKDATNGTDLTVVLTDSAFTQPQTLHLGQRGIEHGTAAVLFPDSFAVAGFASRGTDSQYAFIAASSSGGASRMEEYPALPLPYPNPVPSGGVLSADPSGEWFLTDTAGRKFSLEIASPGYCRIPESVPPGLYLLGNERQPGLWQKIRVK